MSNDITAMLEPGMFVRSVAKVYGPYQQALQDQNAFDFDDQLELR